jgi:hypothetical protein
MSPNRELRWRCALRPPHFMSNLLTLSLRHAPATGSLRATIFIWWQFGLGKMSPSLNHHQYALEYPARYMGKTSSGLCLGLLGRVQSSKVGRACRGCAEIRRFNVRRCPSTNCAGPLDGRARMHRARTSEPTLEGGRNTSLAIVIKSYCWCHSPRGCVPTSNVLRPTHIYRPAR